MGMIKKQVKKNDRKKLLEVYREGDFVYVSTCAKITKEEYIVVIGACQTFIDITKRGNRQCLN